MWVGRFSQTTTSLGQCCCACSSVENRTSGAETAAKVEPIISVAETSNFMIAILSMATVVDSDNGHTSVVPQAANNDYCLAAVIVLAK